MKRIATLMMVLILTLPVAQALSISHAPNPTSEVGPDYAVVEWNTDEPAQSSVFYDRESKNPLEFESNDKVRKKFHSVRLENLLPNTKYFYNIVSGAVVDNNRGDFYSFTTSSGSDTSPPRLTNISVVASTATTTTISWVTDEDASSKVAYGVEAADKEESLEGLRKEHEVTLLTTEGLVYNVVITSCDRFEQCASVTDGFAASREGVTPVIKSVLPRVINDNRVDVVGATTPFVLVTVLVDGVKSRMVKSSATGLFSFKGVKLFAEDNKVTITAEDAAGNVGVEEYAVRIDTVPPVVSLEQIPSLSTASPLVLRGKVSEPATISYTIVSSQKNSFPLRVPEVKVKTGENRIVLSWKSIPDAKEYAVYRDNVLVGAVFTTEFVDSVSSGETYKYHVAGVDVSCNVGKKSPGISVTALDKGRVFVPEARSAKLSCAPDTKELDVDGVFDVSLDVVEGQNTVVIDVVDRAGNKVSISNTTVFDAVAPRFIETNIRDVSPTYTDEIILSGEVSEPASVLVFINDASKPSKVVVTDVSNKFSARVKLNKDIKASVEDTRVSIATAGWENKVRLVAMDGAGRRSESIEETVLFNQCGSGNTFSVLAERPVPDVVTPRLIMSGAQQFGFPFNITYRGSNEVTIQRVRVGTVGLSKAASSSYDHDWISVAPPLFQRGRKDSGYVQIYFPPVDVDGASTSAKEIELSSHRRSECNIPGFGCAKFLLEFEIDAQEKIPERISDPATDRTIENFKITKVKQRNCVEVEVAIDQAIPLASHIPNKFLESATEFLDDAIDVIDSVLEPVNTVGKFLLAGCTAMNGWLFFLFFNEQFECEFAEITSAVGGVASITSIFTDTGSSLRDIASIGACEQALSIGEGGTAVKGGITKEQLPACLSCQEAIKKRVEFEGKMREVCDRVGCPSAPTLQSYIKDSRSTKLKPVLEVVGDTGPKTLFAGSSCAFTGDEVLGNQKLPIAAVIPSLGSSAIPTGTVQLPTNYKEVTTDYKGIKDVYVDYLEHKDDDGISVGGITGSSLNCVGLHPADPRCCGVEYADEWSTACGVPSVYETFDEIKESACLAATHANQIPDLETVIPEPGVLGTKCSSLTNAFAGFCDPETAQAVGDDIATNIKYDATAYAGKVSAWRNEMYVRVEPHLGEEHSFISRYTANIFNDADGAGPKSYKIVRGYISERAERQRVTSAAKKEEEKIINEIAGRDREYYINAQLTFVPDSDGGADLTSYFTGTKEYSPAFAKALCVNAEKDCSAKARAVYNEIKSKIQTSEKRYIVRPEKEGILRSVQCVCLPAISSYLTFWQQMLGAVRSCFESVKVTGDASAGVCEATLSRYVCDMLYESVSCAVNEFSVPGAGKSSSFKGVNDVLGSLTGAGTQLRRSVEGRYGDSSTFKTMFQEKKLLNSVCAFAFTGTWDVDLDTVFEQSVTDIPIQSIGAITPATRRFQGYNPTTRPSGLTTWVYNFGVFLLPGDDVNYYLELQCSDSVQCDPIDGFKNGVCDCHGQGAKTLRVDAPELGSGSLKKGELLDAQVFFAVQAGGSASNIRYDKAVLHWESLDGKTNDVVKDSVAADVDLVGATTPNFCSYDAFTLSYRCDIGIGDYVGARFSSKPSPSYPLSQSVFTKKDTPSFGAGVFLQYPQNTQESGFSVKSYTKFLVWDIKNQQGKSLYTNKDSPLKIDGQGANDIVIETAVTPSDDDFGAKVSSSTDVFVNVCRVRGTNNCQQNNDDVLGKIILNDRSRSFTDVVVISPDGTFMVYASDGKGLDANLKLVSGNSDEKKNGFVTKEEFISSGSLSDSGKSKRVTYKKDSREISFFLKDAPVEYTELVLAFTAQTSTPTNFCDEYKEIPATWTADFELHDSRKLQFGGGFEYDPDQLTTDPSSDEPVRVSVPFKVLCNDKPPATALGAKRCVESKTKALSTSSDQCFCGTTDALKAKLTLVEEGSLPTNKVYNCGKDNLVNKKGLYCYDGGCEDSPGVTDIHFNSWIQGQKVIDKSRVIIADNDPVVVRIKLIDTTRKDDSFKIAYIAVENGAAKRKTIEKAVVDPTKFISITLDDIQKNANTITLSLIDANKKPVEEMQFGIRFETTYGIDWMANLVSKDTNTDIQHDDKFDAEGDQEKILFSITSPDNLAEYEIFVKMNNQDVASKTIKKGINAYTIKLPEYKSGKNNVVIIIKSKVNIVDSISFSVDK